MNVLKQKMILIASVFTKLRTPKTWLDKCLKSPVSVNPSILKMVNVPRHYWNLHHSTFIIFIDHCQIKWVGKCLLFPCQILGLLVKTLAANEKYRVLYRDNLMIPIQMQLSQKQKTFPQFFTAVFKSRLNSKYFETKNEPHRCCVSKTFDSENVVR